MFEPLIDPVAEIYPLTFIFPFILTSPLITMLSADIVRVLVDLLYLQTAPT